MVRIQEEDYEEDYNNKRQEHRNLADYSGKAVEEIEYLYHHQHKEYLRLYKEYESWCLAKFNKDCQEFNDKAKAKMPNSGISV